ncbi:MAG TPA: hypothetical protein VG406_28445 [Isosphaeraceae bacterium]|jgi:hypothetical protein|nr:hypothetical protein [Isosphaeraceae bacterium]
MRRPCHKSGPSRLLGDAKALITVFDEGINARIREGIAQHDQHHYAEALRAYDAVLKDYPDSAWARYERFHTLRTWAMDDPSRPAPDWPTARKAILASDPMYSPLAEAHGDDETADLIRRLEIRMLFKDRARVRGDLVRYADIALDLGQYGLSSYLYWNIPFAIDAKYYEDRPILEYMLYGLEQLGVRSLKEHFKGDHAAAFAAIAKARAELKGKPPARAGRRTLRSGATRQAGPEIRLGRLGRFIYPILRVGIHLAHSKEPLNLGFLMRTMIHGTVTESNFMRRHLLTAATLGVFGLLAVAGDASACCHKRKACAPTPCCAPAPCVVVEPPPPPPCPEPVACCPPKKKHCFSLKLFHHKKRCQPVCATPAPCPPPMPAPCPC